MSVLVGFWLGWVGLIMVRIVSMEADGSKKRVTAVVLAAGRSERMGEAKLLLPWDAPHGASTILGATLANVLAAEPDEVLLVSGAYRQGVEAVAMKMGVRVVHNQNFAAGEMLSSLQTAVRQLPAETAGMLVMLGDLPFVPAGVMVEVMGAFRAGLGEIVAPVCEGRRGHPVLWGRRFFERLLALPATAVPRALMRAEDTAVHLVSVEEEGIWRDIDTPAQYARWRTGR